MEPGLARRYARALFAAAKAERSVIEAEDDLQAITGILDAKPELREVLESPKIPRDRKRELIDKLFADRARPITMRLLRLFIEKRREKILPLVHTEYVRLREDAEGILRIKVSSPTKLSDQEVVSIVKRIEAQTGKRVLHEVELAPSLIGGVTVQYGDFVLDGSISGMLHRLREHLFIEVLKQA